MKEETQKEEKVSTLPHICVRVVVHYISVGTYVATDHEIVVVGVPQLHHKVNGLVGGNKFVKTKGIAPIIIIVVVVARRRRRRRRRRGGGGGRSRCMSSNVVGLLVALVALWR